MLKWFLNLEHRWNPLHVYCRLVERGSPKKLSIFLCRCYEIFIYFWIMWLVRSCNYLWKKILSMKQEDE